MVDSMAKSASSGIPNEILALVEKRFLFKVEVMTSLKLRSEPSYTVKKLCIDEAIIQKFIAKFHSTEPAVDDGLSCENVAQDLMPKFADVVGDSHQGFADPKSDPITTDSGGFIHTEGVVAEKNSVNDESSQNVVSLTQVSTFSNPPDGMPSQKNLGLPNDSNALTPMKRGPPAEGIETAELIPLKAIKIEKP